MYEKLCFSNNKSTPSLWVTQYVCASWWADVFTSVSVCVRQCWWHNSVAGVWLRAELCRSCWLFCWSLSVSVTRSVINHPRLGDQTTLPYWSLCWLKHSTSPDQHGRTTVQHIWCQSYRKSRPQIRQCLIIAQGHLRLSILTWEINSVPLARPYIRDSDMNTWFSLDSKCSYSDKANALIFKGYDVRRVRHLILAR